MHQRVRGGAAGVRYGRRDRHVRRRARLPGQRAARGVLVLRLLRQLLNAGQVRVLLQILMRVAHHVGLSRSRREEALAPIHAAEGRRLLGVALGARHGAREVQRCSAAHAARRRRVLRVRSVRRTHQTRLALERLRRDRPLGRLLALHQSGRALD